MRSVHATQVVRLPADLAEMLSAIAWSKREHTAAVADEIIRKAVQTKFDKLPPEFRDPALVRIARLTAAPEAATASAK